MDKKLIRNISSENLGNELSKIHQFIFDNSHDIILFVSEDGYILTANKMAIKKYGYTYDELTSMNIKQLRHTSMDCTYIDELTLFKKVDSGIIYEGIHITKSEDELPVEVSSGTILHNNEIFRILIIRDTTERKTMEKRLVYLANYDALTNIANRANIISQLDNSIEKAKLTGNNIAFMLFDIDKFKAINDNFGHLFGDKVLKYVAKTVKNLLRTDDSIGRFGGDEFVIIQRYVKNKDDVIPLINRIFKVFESPVILENNSINIKISIGICLLSDAKNRNDLIYQADSAMYVAKKTLGCSFEFFNNIK